MANQYTAQKIDVGEAVKLYRSGATQVEVAEILGTTQKVIWRRLQKAGIKCREAAPRNQKGSLNNNWKGGDVGYAAFHKRVEVAKGRPRVCEVCDTTDPKRSYDWANLTGRYDDPDDYKRMCRSCHWKLDQKINNIKHMRKKVAREKD